MRRDEFEPQVERLKATWPNSFPDEKVKVIWLATKDHCLKWFERQVTAFIAGSAKAPLPAEFIEAASLEDKRRYLGPSANRPVLPERSVFKREEIDEFFSVMKDAMTGKVSRKDALEYANMVAVILKQRGITPEDYVNPTKPWETIIKFS